MKKTVLAMAAIALTLLTQAQQDGTATKKADTLRIGNMIIIRKEGKEDTHKKWQEHQSYRRKASKNNTNWMIIDLGLNQIHDQTSYPVYQASNPAIRIAPGANEDWFKLRNNKSINVNIWFFMQRISLIEQVVNLKYGLGLELNNYRYSTPIRYTTDPTRVVYIPPYEYTIRKNKLAADYVTVPLMLNFNFTPKEKTNGFGLSAGVSAGYLYSSRQKLITSNQGKEKIHNDFDLRPFKLSYIAELHLGPIKLYGSLATQSMFNKGLDQIPYNVGLRFSNW